MKTIWQQTMEGVANGARFQISFENRSLKLNKSYLIKDGQYEGELGCDPYVGDAVSQIEVLYGRYLHSIPSERSENKRHLYFRALTEDKLDNDDMLYGLPREETRAALELFILCQLIHGALKWQDFAAGKWFWQSTKYPSLILLKQWFEQSVNS